LLEGKESIPNSISIKSLSAIESSTGKSILIRQEGAVMFEPIKITSFSQLTDHILKSTETLRKNYKLLIYEFKDDTLIENDDDLSFVESGSKVIYKLDSPPKKDPKKTVDSKVVVENTSKVDSKVVVENNSKVDSKVVVENNSKAAENNNKVTGDNHKVAVENNNKVTGDNNKVAVENNKKKDKKRKLERIESNPEISRKGKKIVSDNETESTSDSDSSSFVLDFYKKGTKRRRTDVNKTETKKKQQQKKEKVKRKLRPRSNSSTNSISTIENQPKHISLLTAIPDIKNRLIRLDAMFKSSLNTDLPLISSTPSTTLNTSPTSKSTSSAKISK